MWKQVKPFILTENCSCSGVGNEWKEGAKCKAYQGYSIYESAFMNSKWCYAETTTCIDATTVEPIYTDYYVDNGRYGPSQSACSNPGNVNKTIPKQYIFM